MPNPSGNYSRVKTWGVSDTVLASDLNAEFDNVLNNFNPEMLAGYSQNQAQMQTQTAPGAVGSESLATALSGELERLRFAIAAISGTTYWYQTPASTIAQINSLIGASSSQNKINSGRTSGTTGSAQPMFLVAANTTNSVTLKASTTALSYAINGTTYAVAADTTLSGLTLAPSSSNTATVSDLTLPQAGASSTKMLGENGSQITVSAAGSNITSLVGNWAAFKTTAGEYLLAYVESSTQITQALRGFFFNSSDTLVSRGTISNGDTLTLMKLTWVYVNTAGGVQVVYTNPAAGGVAPSSPASGDMWYDTSVNYWKTYNSTSWIQANVTPIGVCIQDTANTVAARSADFFESYSDTNTCEIFADQQNDATVVRSRFRSATVSVYGTQLVFPNANIVWSFGSNLDTGAQAASTMYYFYIDTNGRPWISLTAPHDRRSDLRGYYHPGAPWRCLGYGWSNAATALENVESFFLSDEARPVSNITAANNNIILPYNIIQREQVITLSAAGGAFTQVLPPPRQVKGKFLTFVRTDGSISNLITLQSWGTSVVATSAGTISVISNPTVMTGVSTASMVAGQLITGPGVPPNTTVSSLATGVVTMSQSAQLTVTGGNFTFSNAAGYSGTVGQQTSYLSYGLSGLFSTTLATQGETVTLTADDWSYYIVARYIPQVWVNSGTVSLSASAGGAVKGTTSLDQLLWSRQGRDIYGRFDYIQTAAGTAGTAGGIYLIALPSGLTFDTSALTTSTNGTIAATGAGVIGAIGGALLGSSVASGAISLTALAYDSTHLKWFGTGSINGAGEPWGVSIDPLSSTNIGISGWFRGPITGWAG